MKIVNMPTVNANEIEKELNIRIFDCEFAQMVENGSYVPLFLDENQIAEDKEEIEACDDGTEDSYVQRLKNELTVIEYFRSIGYSDKILIYISW